MKTAFFQAVASLVAFAPFTQANAKPPGGFEAGTTFKLIVTERSSIKISQFSSNDHASIPRAIPNFGMGQLVKFRIGKKGQLTAKGLNLPLVAANSAGNIYGSGLSGTSKNFMAQMEKKGRTKPELIVLTFTMTKGSGVSTTIQTVSYTLE